MAAGGTGASMGASLLTGSPPDGLGDMMGGEQGSASNSALKTIQPGQTNSFNAKMAKSAGADYKGVDFLSARNMTWTSKPSSNEGLQRMGIKDRNFPKQIGSTVIGGVSGALGASGASSALSSISSLFMFEGGDKEVPLPE